MARIKFSKAGTYTFPYGRVTLTAALCGGRLQLEGRSTISPTEKMVQQFEQEIRAAVKAAGKEFVCDLEKIYMFDQAQFFSAIE